MVYCLDCYISLLFWVYLGVLSVVEGDGVGSTMNLARGVDHLSRCPIILSKTKRRSVPILDHRSTGGFGTCIGWCGAAERVWVEPGHTCSCGVGTLHWDRLPSSDLVKHLELLNLWTGALYLHSPCEGADMSYRPCAWRRGLLDGSGHGAVVSSGSSSSSA